MTSNNIDGNEIKFAYLGLWLIMSMQVKTNIHECFSSSKIDPYTSGSLFNLNDVMAYNRFCKITRALTYTDLDPHSK